MILTLYEVYNKRARINKIHKLTLNSRFYQAHYKNNVLGYNFAPLQGIPVFSPAMILQEQKIRAKSRFFNKKYTQELTELNNIISLPFLNDFQFEQTETEVLEKAFQDFDNGLIGGFYNTQNKQQTFLDLKNWYKKHEQEMLQLESVCQHLYEISKYNTQININILDKFANILQELKADIAVGEQLLNIPIPSSRSYLQRSVYIATCLKGYLFEDEVYKFLKNNIPQGIAVVNTANIYMESTDLFGNFTGNKGKMMRTDFGIISEEAAANIIGLKWTIDGNPYEGTLLDFIHSCNSKDGEKATIKIDDKESAKQIKDNLIGIQAKSNLGKINFLKKNKTGKIISLKTVIDEHGNPAQQILWKLHLLVDKREKYQAHLVDTHDIYDAYFNYTLGKFLAEIIGLENQIMITRKGFQTVQEFLLDSFSEGKYLQATTRVHLRYADKAVNVALK